MVGKTIAFAMIAGGLAVWFGTPPALATAIVIGVTAAAYVHNKEEALERAELDTHIASMREAPEQPDENTQGFMRKGRYWDGDL